ncbi:unnamed protein product [Caenorhabditis brenneri]
MLLLLLFLNLLVVWGKLDSGVPACKDGLVVFEAPEGYTLETWYPKEFPIDSWNRERTFKNVTLFPKNYKCKYQIKVPEGWIGRLYLTSKRSNKNSKEIRVSGHVGNDYSPVTYAVDQFFQFTGKDGFVELDTDLGEVSFGFKVEWIQPCNGTIIIEPPQDDTSVTWLPKKYRGRFGSHSGRVPFYPIDYKCRYLIKVPTGHSARVFVTVGHPDDHFPVQVTRQNGEMENVTYSTESPFDFVYSDGIIDLDTGKSEKVRFGLKIEWVKPCSTPIHFNPPEGNSSLWYPHEYTRDRPPQMFPKQL